MKRFLVTLFGSLLCVSIVHMLLFDNAFTFKSISDAFFVVGLIMFFCNLIAISKARNGVLIVGYSIKSVLKRLLKQSDFNYTSYYDYLKDKQQESVSSLAIQAFIISIVYIVTSLVLAQFVTIG